jgi:UDP-N-acetylglucosamine--N-acetylmuramyl-(pentapeptide) pyrophosphoryl-undecaprenol N-acetylglucosamine transferase
MRVVLAGGGSAGHIEPALALADALREADKSVSVTCLGTERGLETRLVPLRGYDLELMPAVPLPRSLSAKYLTVPGRLAGAIRAVGKVLERTSADVLVGFGGYVSAPAYLAARRHDVPIVVHEANPRPGVANRLGAMMTTHVFTGHPEARLRNARYIGLPIRRQIAELDRLALGDTAREHFGLRTDMPVLLVTGGSQGARSLNRALAGAVDAIRAAGVQILHVTGPKNASEITPSPGRVPYVGIPYVDRMDLAYAAADFALCRAGAMTCAELTAVGLPAAYVPLPIGNGEQRLNAMPIVQQGGGMIVDDAELTAEWIKSSLVPVLTNVDRVVAMSEAAARLGRRDADRALARAVMDVAASTPPRPAAIAPAAQPEPPAPGQQAPQQAPYQQTPGQPAPRRPAPHYQSAPVPEGGFFQPTQERAATQRAASMRPAPAPGSAPSPGRHRHAR